MSPFEYLLVLAAVVLGLAVSDLAVSLNRLLDAGGRVRWDWLAPLAALAAILKIVTQWWSWYQAAPIAGGLTFGMYLGVLASAVLLFLLAAVALPDRIGDGEFALAGYFERTKRRYWLLFAAHFAVSNAVSIWAQVTLERATWVASPVYLIFPAAILLAFMRPRPMHAGALIGLIGLYVGQLFSHTLGR